VDALSWLVRQASGEQVVSCHRNQHSGREVHEVATASGALLVIRGQAEGGIGLDQEAWFLARAREAGVPAPEVLWLGAVDTPAGSRTAMVQAAAAARLARNHPPGRHDGASNRLGLTPGRATRTIRLAGRT